MFSSSVNLSSRSELDLGGTIRGESGIALLLNLLVSSSFDGNSSGLCILVLISNLQCSLSYLPIATLFPEAILMQCLYIYVLYIY